MTPLRKELWNLTRVFETEFVRDAAHRNDLAIHILRLAAIGPNGLAAERTASHDC